MTTTHLPGNLRRVEPRIILFFFAALALFYLAFSPATIEGMGYYGENLNSADQLASNLINLAHRQPLVPVSWTRHGGLEMVFELPFVLLSRALFGASVKWAGRVLSLQPILATALSITLLYVWSHRLSENRSLSLFLALIAAFATMLWPYAYIGLETTQSLFLLAAAYMALARQGRHTWPEILAFAGCCATALAVKSTGLFLLPALTYLIFCYFSPKGIYLRVAKLAVFFGIVVFIFALNYHLKESYFAGIPGGSAGFFTSLLVDGPVIMLLQVLSFFGSANKSLLIYAPVVVLCLVNLPKTYRFHPRLVIFALLALGGLIAGFSLVTVWAEETWGPRYLHTAIAPLLVCLSGSQLDFSERRQKFLLSVAAALGLAVTLPGVLIAYPSLHQAMTRSGRATLPALQYDPVFSHVRFNYQLLSIWLMPRNGLANSPSPWPPPPLWWFDKPVDAAPEKTVDLREWATPQPAMLRAWTPAMSISPRQHLFLRLLLGGCLSLSLALFFWLTILVRRETDSVSGFTDKNE